MRFRGSKINVPSTPVSRRSHRLVFGVGLLASKHRLQILQQLRITPM